MKQNYMVLGDLKPIKYGIVDYIADGLVKIGSDTVSCKVGFNEVDGIVTPEYLFIDNTICGDTFHHAETIKL